VSRLGICPKEMIGVPSKHAKNVRTTAVISGRGAARAEDAQRTPTQSHISPSILACEDKHAKSQAIGAMSAVAGTLWDARLFRNWLQLLTFGVFAAVFRTLLAWLLKWLQLQVRFGTRGSSGFAPRGRPHCSQPLPSTPASLVTLNPEP
jgi:hypothetical protein